ncbi:glycosyltransferase [Mucilaginibacter terrae]|uniref:MGT family glycosyltransferase n=1 Tax=Mucilaginibacter terrae TaxID=1955052 RepID=A0ABU3GRD9_9SPHI|nr:glycosyltransferase [Mucilaginibacter terrae]MDT3402334.1 MGT family glycosyltransferase [Mucilaginibacter terrae]
MENLLKESLMGKTILFSNLPADGHFNPLTGIAKFLQGIGCDVRWFASRLYKDRIERLGIPYYALINAPEVNAGNLVKLVPGITTNDPLKRSNMYRSLYATNGKLYYEDIRALHEVFPFDLLICDSFFPAIPFIKHNLGIPVISIGVVPLAEDSPETAPYGLGLHPPKDDEEKSGYAELYRQMPQKFKESSDLFQALLNEADISYPGLSYENILIRSVDRYLQIGSPGFEYPRERLGANIRFIGGLLPFRPDPQENKPWFDEKLLRYDKVVLVTQGTIELDTRKLLEPTLDAFAGTDTLIIATTSGNNTDKLREKYNADNVIIEAFIPFDQVMPHVDVYVTNGGYGGVILGILYGLPMVAAGLHEGKNEVCARIAYFDLGIDLQTENPTSAQVREAVDRIFLDVKYKKAVSRLAAEFLNYDGQALVVEAIHEVLSNSRTWEYDA